jgi:GTP-binding protein
MTEDSEPKFQHQGPSTQDSALRTQHSSLITIKTAEFETSATQPRHYPVGNLPEIAFAGRSNVGKSSLINCLVQRKKLVRTSRTPGLTRLINFFKINGGVYFVDLPGYGFAKVPEKVRAQWKPMVETYLLGRNTLRGVVLIMDARHLPTPDDLQLWAWLQDRRIAAIPVLTKVDKNAQSKRSSLLKAAAQALTILPERLVIFSSVTGSGRLELMERIEGLLDLTGDDPATPRGEEAP